MYPQRYHSSMYHSNYWINKQNMEIWQLMVDCPSNEWKHKCWQTNPVIHTHLSSFMFLFLSARTKEHPKYKVKDNCSIHWIIKKQTTWAAALLPKFVWMTKKQVSHQYFRHMDNKLPLNLVQQNILGYSSNSWLILTNKNNITESNAAHLDTHLVIKNNINQM